MYIGRPVDVSWNGKETNCYGDGLNRLPDADKPLTATLTAPTAPSSHTSGGNPLKSCFAPISRWTQMWKVTCVGMKLVEKIPMLFVLQEQNIWLVANCKSILF